MKKYNFTNLSEDLTMGREIEFLYCKIQYSIVNFDRQWIMVTNDGEGEKEEILCGFYNREKLIDLISKYRLNGITIKEFFDSDIEIEDLYIL